MFSVCWRPFLGCGAERTDTIPTSVTRLQTAMIACSLRVDTERRKLLCTRKLASSTIELTYVPSCTWRHTVRAGGQGARARVRGQEGEGRG